MGDLVSFASESAASAFEDDDLDLSEPDTGPASGAVNPTRKATTRGMPRCSSVNLLLFPSSDASA